eukprot:1142598-Pelagomonas_calceolata.AAC.3
MAEILYLTNHWDSKSLQITQFCGLAGQMRVAECQKVRFTLRPIMQVAPTCKFQAQGPRRPPLSSYIVPATPTDVQGHLVVPIWVSQASNLRSRPEGVADLLVSKLTGWVVGFYVGSGDWGSGFYGIIEPLPAIVMVAGGISRAELVFFVHV